MPRCWWSPPTTVRARRRSSTWRCSTRWGSATGWRSSRRSMRWMTRGATRWSTRSRRLLEGTSLAGVPVLAVSSIDGTGVEDVRLALRRVSDARRRSRRPHARAAADARDRPGLRGQGSRRRGHRHAPRRTAGPRRVRARAARRRATRERARSRSTTPRSTSPVPAGRRSTSPASRPRRSRAGRSSPPTQPSWRPTGSSCAFERRCPTGARARLHLGTAAVDAAIGRSGRDAIDLPDGTAVAAILRLAEPVAAAPGDRFVLRRPSGRDQVVGGQVVDVMPARGVSRRRQTSARVAAWLPPSRPATWSLPQRPGSSSTAHWWRPMASASLRMSPRWRPMRRSRGSATGPAWPTCEPRRPAPSADP